jgi:ketosteroid isomerase-like protein
VSSRIRTGQLRNRVGQLDRGFWDKPLINLEVAPEQVAPLIFTVQGDRVVVKGKNRGTVRSTGRSHDHEWVMLFRIRACKSARLRHYYSTADVLVAFGGD